MAAASVCFVAFTISFEEHNIWNVLLNDLILSLRKAIFPPDICPFLIYALNVLSPAFVNVNLSHRLSSISSRSIGFLFLNVAMRIEVSFYLFFMLKSHSVLLNILFCLWLGTISTLSLKSSSAEWYIRAFTISVLLYCLMKRQPAWCIGLIDTIAWT